MSYPKNPTQMGVGVEFLMAAWQQNVVLFCFYTNESQ